MASGSVPVVANGRVSFCRVADWCSMAVPANLRLRLGQASHPQVRREAGALRPSAFSQVRRQTCPSLLSLECPGRDTLVDISHLMAHVEYPGTKIYEYFLKVEF